MKRLAALLLCGCGSVNATGGNDLAPAIENQPGKFSHQLQVETMDRELIVYVPEKARGTTRAPVVMMFHGTSGDGEKFFNISGWKEKADAEGLIAVFPSALTHCYHEDENFDGDFDDPGERAVTTKWMAWDWATTTKFQQCTASELTMLQPARRLLADHPPAEDLAFVDAIIDFLSSHYSIDGKRIYATGFSNGASFTSRLSMERADKLAAVAASSGSLNMSPVVAAARPLSLASNFGEIEDGISERLGIAALPLEEALLTKVPAVKAAFIAPMLTVLRLADSYSYEEETIGGMKVVRFVYSTSSAGAGNRFTFQVHEGQTHQYPNGTNHPIVMADELWDFFRDQRLP